MANTELTPYRRSESDLLKAVFVALEACCILIKEWSESKVKKSQREMVSALRKKILLNTNEFFNSGNYPYSANGINNHINQDRLASITSYEFLVAHEGSERNDRSTFLPSPLHILYQLLTIPEEVASQSFSYEFCKAFCFDEFDFYPSTLRLNKGVEKIFTISDLRGWFQSYQNYINKRDPRPFSTTNGINLTGYLLSITGHLYLRFKNPTKKESNNLLNADEQRSEFCKLATLNLYKLDHDHDIKLEFKLHPDIEKTPSFTSFCNQVFGVSLPFRGADILFHQGLKAAENGSLVINLNGSPGTGKTSVALSISAALSTLGTSTLYLSTEECPADIYQRLATIIPYYFNKLSFHKKKESDWFKAIDASYRNLRAPLSSTNDEPNPLKQQLESFIIETEESYKLASSSSDRMTAIGSSTFPLLVIIDSITGAFGNESSYLEIDNFIRKCRSIGALVIAISSEEIHVNTPLDYLVDTVINVRLSDTDNPLAKPRRYLKILKSRQQNSEMGSHLMHIDGEEGIRFAPHISSQIDYWSQKKITIPDSSSINNAFNVLSEKGTQKLSAAPIYKNLQIYEFSNTVIYGTNDRENSKIGLKILGYPFIKDSHIKETSPNILVISFLHPEEYYKPVVKSLKYLIKPIYQTKIETEYNYLVFYPGNLAPEDFLSKVSRAIIKEKLKGNPYTAVLVDGIHNVYLQFPNLQESTNLWPVLYNLLAREKLTVCSTFANLEKQIPANAFPPNPSVSQEIIHDQLPIMQILRQSCDNLARIRKISDENDIKKLKDFKSGTTKKHYSEKDEGNTYKINIEKSSAPPQKNTNKLYWCSSTSEFFTLDRSEYEQVLEKTVPVQTDFLENDF